MSLILGGERYEIPGVRTVSWLDDSRIPAVPETLTNPRRLPVQMIVAHTSWGQRAVVLPSCGVGGQSGLALARHQLETERPASWDYTIDETGTVLVQNDPISRYTWHAGSVNPRSIGFEIVQRNNDRRLFQCQIDAALRLSLFLMEKIGIPKQTPTVNGAPDKGVIDRVREGGSNVFGLIGHRNQTPERGEGDPGDAFFQTALSQGLVRGFDFRRNEDLNFWRQVQSEIGMTATGKADRATVAAVRARRAPTLAYSLVAPVAITGPQQQSIPSWIKVAGVAAIAYGVWRYAEHQRRNK